MAPPPVQTTSSQPLPAREQAIFKKIVRCYEQKQYRNGMKHAKAILSNAKFADHGETLAMRGLILNCTGKREEAAADVKRGLKADLKSAVCWHVYGLVQRSEKKYDEAVKAYRNALKLDQENMQILRDLSLLQIQIRDLEGYRDTRYKLLTLRPTQRPSWIGYAIAHHLLQDYDMALKIIDEFSKTQSPNTFDYENSELLLYRNLIVRESGRLDEALNHLEENALLICDKLAYTEIRAELFYKLGRIAEATKCYEMLIDRNPENLAYYSHLERCRGIDCTTVDADSIERRLDVYRAAQQRNPRASLPKRFPLTFLPGSQFISAAKPYLIAGFRKGVPALFQQLRYVYSDSVKTADLEQLLLEYVNELEMNGRFPGESYEDENHLESPTTILWVYYFLAQHFDRLSQHVRALTYIDLALKHTPTLIELLVTKAKIHKHMDDDATAACLMDEAQSLDTADRFVNSKCAKYFIRAGRILDAQLMCAKFTRDSVPVTQCLNEMQCMWFETECAKSFRKTGQWGDALKKCHEVDRHFTGIIEDQFDFHTYCLRKMTLCAYIGLLRLEDVLRKHRFYVRAAKCGMKIYLRLHERPFDEQFADGVGSLSKADAKKKLSKEKKRAAKAEMEKAKQQQEKPKPKPDPDIEPDFSAPLDADVLLKTEKPLDEAAKFARPLLDLKCDDLAALALCFEVYFQRGRFLLMLQCVERMHQLDANYAKAVPCQAKLLDYYASAVFEEWPMGVLEMVNETLTAILGEERDSRRLLESKGQLANDLSSQSE